jgi:carbonic anhydrase
MSLVSEILEFNRGFVQRRDFEQFRTDRFPDKKTIILTCMDTRLVELLPRAMNLRNGDVKIIKTAGAIIAHPFGSMMRSIIVAVYELGAREVLVIGHHDCGMTGLSCARILDKARERGVSEHVIQTLGNSGIDLKQWLVGFDHVTDGVVKSVDVIRNHPLLPRDVAVHGMLIHPETGKLELVVDGYGGPGSGQPG